VQIKAVRELVASEIVAGLDVYGRLGNYVLCVKLTTGDDGFYIETARGYTKVYKTLDSVFKDALRIGYKRLNISLFLFNGFQKITEAEINNSIDAGCL